VAVLQYVDSGSDEEAEDGPSGVGIAGLPVYKRSHLAVFVEDVDMDFSVRSPWMSDVVRAAEAAASAAVVGAAGVTARSLGVESLRLLDGGVRGTPTAASTVRHGSVVGSVASALRPSAASTVVTAS
jgi:hypothetical protein